jgi:hypothetical protein
MQFGLGANHPSADIPSLSSVRSDASGIFSADYRPSGMDVSYPEVHR